MKILLVVSVVTLTLTSCKREPSGGSEKNKEVPKAMNDTPESDAIERLDPELEDSKAILSPDWSIVENHFGTKVPQILKSLYQDPNRVLLTEFDVVSDSCILEIDDNENLHVVNYTIIDENILQGSFDDMENFFPIASGLGGEEYVINITEADPKVYFYQYDIGDDPEKFQYTGLLLSEFITAKKIPTQRYKDE